MAGLQRSSVSFRRQGSSGMIWNDKCFSGELKPSNLRPEENQPQFDGAVSLRSSRSLGSSGSFGRARSSTSQRMKIASPSPSPPPPNTANPSSPKFAMCGFCGVFGRPVGSPRHQKSNKR